MTVPYQNFETSQDSFHPRLLDVVNKHLLSSYLRPMPSHQGEAFLKIKQFAKSLNRPLIIDSCCGTGLSTKQLAMLFPDHGVIGIDKSKARLGRAAPNNLKNMLLVRGNVIDLWRLLAFEGLPVVKHYLFFPNPWPKISQMKRRFHAHPVFKTMVSLSPYFELRTNWRVYALECTMALEALGQKPLFKEKTDNKYFSLFEKKYLESKCPIYVVTNNFSFSIT